MEDNKKLLSWFLGPKSENSLFLEESLLLILRDYFHWRRNYFPSDSMIINKQQQRELEPDLDTTQQNLIDLMAKLRRNFPFYSPRYIGHMLSDTLLPGILGYIAGMMYNPNNVTPEAAPVTVDLEIEACNILLKMLGFNPPPDTPKELDAKSIKEYKKSLETQFGWGHLTFGGTTANLEALWVARTVKYSALAIWDVAQKENLDIEVKLPDGKSSKDIKDFSSREILFIKPNEAIYLLAKYVDSCKTKFRLDVGDANEKANSLLKKSPYHLSHGVGKVYSEFPPVIFVSGTAHYSFHKSADILGIGQDNIKFVEVDSGFRMDMADLEKKVQFALAENQIPLAVVPIVGTTEEGAIDPVHKVLDFRKSLENQKNISFWIHVDAAWGGYFRSLFNLSAEDEAQAILTKAAKVIGTEFKSFEDWHSVFFKYLENKIAPNHTKAKKSRQDSEEGKSTAEKINKLISREKETLTLLQTNKLEDYIKAIKKLAYEFDISGLDKSTFDLNLEDRVDLVNEYTDDNIPLRFGQYSSEVNVRWGAKDICSAIIGMASADSITVDPHKMGYINYPCGMIAFRNDRIRHFILQKAPYITSARQEILVHMPPKHIGDIENEPKIVTDAFAPFIVEGSRPGAAAAALWLTVKTVPPTMRENGLIIKSSILAARELYEWLVHWAKISSFNQIDVDYQLIPYTLYPPDTNIVIFAVKKKASNSILKMNELTKLVYDKFTIQAELGENEYSYSQPFFLSKTTFEEPMYSFDTFKPFFKQYFGDSLDRVRNEYKKEGLVVLRAAVMNPYLWFARNNFGQNALKEFIKELTETAAKSSKFV